MEEFFGSIKSASIFSGIDESELRTLLSCLGATETGYSAGEYILRVGDTPESVGLALDGSALVVKEDYWGNRNIVTKLISGDIFAEAYACSPTSKMDVSVLAETECRILWLAVRKVMTTCSSACVHHAVLIRNLVTGLASKNLQMNEKISHMAQRTTREKVLSYLYSQSQKTGVREFDIPFDRQQFADFLSVERSALSAELSKMKKDGLISYNKNHFLLNRSD